MKSNFGGFILSYLMDDKIKRENRIKVHHEQVDWWIQNTDINLKILAMNYREEDFQNDYISMNRIEYFIMPPMKTTIARNKLFEIFYSSEYDWGIIMDNDSTLYNNIQHNSGHKLFSEMDKQIELYRNINIFFPINPVSTPFTKTINDEIHIQNHVFNRNLGLKASLFVMQNFRRKKEKELWLDERFDYYEDRKMALDAIFNGYRVYCCENIVLKEGGQLSSSFDDGDSKKRREPIKQANRLIIDDYGLEGMQLKSTENSTIGEMLVSKKFINKHWKGKQKEVILKPSTDYLSKNLIG